MELDELRKRIDSLDDEILRLLNQRYETVMEIGSWKKNKSGAIYVPEREKAVLNRLCLQNQGPMSNATLRAVYREIMSGALSLEYPLRVAYLGPEATYTHHAALSKFGRSVGYVAKPNLGEVFSAVASGQAEYGCVPVENSTEGVVSHTLDMFLEWPDVMICAEINMQIHHSLLSLSGMSQIRKVYAHPQTFGQCRCWFRENMPGVELLETASNTRACELAAKDPEAAAVASPVAAEVYGLTSIRDRIEDNPDNTTRFLVLSHQNKTALPTGTDKTSVCFSIRDRVGALYDSLLPFKKEELTLSMIESRPSRAKRWEYHFFIDILGHKDDEAVKRALSELESLASVRILGSYPRGSEAE